VSGDVIVGVNAAQGPGDRRENHDARRSGDGESPGRGRTPIGIGAGSVQVPIRLGRAEDVRGADGSVEADPSLTPAEIAANVLAQGAGLVADFLPRIPSAEQFLEQLDDLGDGLAEYVESVNPWLMGAALAAACEAVLRRARDSQARPAVSANSEEEEDAGVPWLPGVSGSWAVEEL